MPAKSEKQRHFMNLVYAHKTGKTKGKKLSAGLRAKLDKVANSMSVQTINHFRERQNEKPSFKSFLLETKDE